MQFIIFLDCYDSGMNYTLTLKLELDPGNMHVSSGLSTRISEVLVQTLLCSLLCVHVVEIIFKLFHVLPVTAPVQTRFFIHALK